MLSTHKLHHAVVLAEQRSFRKAAELLNLSQPAVSRSIQSLEATLGVPLFDRHPRGIELTAFGEVVIEHAQVILAETADIEHEIGLLRGLDIGTLEVSLGPYPSALSGQRAVAGLLAKHPDIQCRVRVEGFDQVVDDVEGRRCEIGVADLDATVNRKVNTELLVSRPVYLLAHPNHALFSKRGCALGDVLRFPWAGVRAPARMAAVLPPDMGRAAHWDEKTGQLAPALEVEVVTDFLTLACKSDILVITTLTMAENELATGQLAAVPFYPSWMHLAYGFIVRPNHSLSPAALEFMALVREIEADLEEREAALRERYLR